MSERNDERLDVVDRALDAARREPVPAGPPARAVEDVLRRIEGASARRRRFLRVSAAAAAALLAAVGAWTLLRGPGTSAPTAPVADYPAIRLEGDARVVGPDEQEADSPRRGDRVIAGAGGAILRLGGYCTLTMPGGSEVVLRGEPGNESVDLDRGCLVSKVEHGKGGFSVRTPAGTLRVIGTEFVTTVEGGERSSVTVTVSAGSVWWDFGGESGRLDAGATRAFLAAAAPAAPKSAPPVSAKADEAETSKITVSFKSATLDDVLDEIAKQSGNARIKTPAKWEDEPVTFAAKDLPYWRAVNELCRSLGHVYYDVHLQPATSQADGMALVTRSKGQDVGDVSGPVSVKLNAAHLYRTLRGTPGAASSILGYPGADMLLYDFVYFWEDRLEALSWEAEVTRAVAPDGKEMRLLPPDRRLSSIAMWAPGQHPFCSRFSVGLTDLPKKLDRIAEIDGVVRLTFGGGEKKLTIPDVMKASGKSFTAGDVTVTVVRAAVEEGAATVVVEIKKGGAEIDVPAYPNNPEYGFTFTAADGQRRTPGTWDGFAMVHSGPGDASMRKAPFKGAPPAKGERGLVFYGKFDGPATLTYTFPSDATSKEFPFTLKDVPLP